MTLWQVQATFSEAARIMSGEANKPDIGDEEYEAVMEQLRANKRADEDF